MIEADLRDWLPVLGVILGDDQFGHILDEAEHDRRAYVSEGGRAMFDLRAHLVAATRV